MCHRYDRTILIGYVYTEDRITPFAFGQFVKPPRTPASLCSSPHPSQFLLMAERKRRIPVRAWCNQPLYCSTKTCGDFVGGLGEICWHSPLNQDLDK